MQPLKSFLYFIESKADDGGKGKSGRGKKRAATDTEDTGKKKKKTKVEKQITDFLMQLSQQRIILVFKLTSIDGSELLTVKGSSVMGTRQDQSVEYTLQDVMKHCHWKSA